MPRIPIGSFVVEDATFGAELHHLLHRDKPARYDDNDNAAAADVRATRGLPSPLLLRDSARVLLQGPRHLTSSLTMDLALSLASSYETPCHCCLMSSEGENGNSFYATTDSTRRGGCEHSCVAVAILVPITNTGEDDAFPFLCRPAVDDDDTGDDEMILAVSSSPLTCSRRHRESSRSVRDKPADDLLEQRQRQHEALRRIQVRHVASVEDVWQYLLSLPGLPVDQQPVGGILMDSLEHLMQLQPHSDAAAVAIRMSQTGTYNFNEAVFAAQHASCFVCDILMHMRTKRPKCSLTTLYHLFFLRRASVALAMDTAACLHRMHGRLPTVLVTLEHQDAAAAPANQYFQSLSFWSPTSLQLVPAAIVVAANDSTAMRHAADGDDVAVSHWTVEHTATEEKIATLRVVQNRALEQRIVWERSECRGA